MRKFIQVLEEASLPEAAGDSFNYDLKAKYAEFNAKYFNGELPECKLRFGVLKRKGGHCTCSMRAPNPPLNPRYLRLRGLPRTHGYTLVPGSISITISTTYMRDHADIDAILLHEMIHAWFFYKEQFDVDHNGPFLAMRRDISQKSGINIPLTDDSKHLELSSEVKHKRVGVFIYDEGDGRLLFGLVSPKAMDTVQTRALEKVAWIDRTRRNPNLHVCMRLVSGPYWTRKALETRVSRDRIKSLYVLKPEDHTVALEEFKKGEEVFEYWGEKAAARDGQD